MRRPLFVALALAAVASAAGSSIARGQFEHGREPGRAAFVVRHAAPAPATPPATPAPTTAYVPGDPSLGGTFEHHHHHHHGGGWGGLPGYGTAYWVSPWYVYAPQPFYLPAGNFFGPQAAGFAPGWNNPAPAAPLAPAAPKALKDPPANNKARGVGGFGELADDNAKEADRPKVRTSNAEAVARARQFIGFGDEHFRTQEFSDAYQRYKKAASAAPDLADAFFRQGFSLLAMGRYEPAARAFKHGLTLKPDWAKSSFRLDELYGDNRLAKATHLERLAAEATAHPQNADLMLLLGLGLHFDGQAERARPFFEHAAELGADRQAVAGFLKPAVDAAAGEQARRREL